MSVIQGQMGDKTNLHGGPADTSMIESGGHNKKRHGKRCQRSPARAHAVNLESVGSKVESYDNAADVVIASSGICLICQLFCSFLSILQMFTSLSFWSHTGKSIPPRLQILLWLLWPFQSTDTLSLPSHGHKYNVKPPDKT